MNTTSTTPALAALDTLEHGFTEGDFKAEPTDLLATIRRALEAALKPEKDEDEDDGA